MVRARPPFLGAKLPLLDARLCLIRFYGTGLQPNKVASDRANNNNGICLLNVAGADFGAASRNKCGVKMAMWADGAANGSHLLCLALPKLILERVASRSLGIALLLPTFQESLVCKL
ncbi:hypothetical protein VOLCADRAFT_91006 [Volvox carteri f. nagariensis]|uniref:Uncharacterized protein n=1 Tax=Volvox carteri f. nagariensis TaxID=3068 RepID=D8TVX9_VOLCA|nr:uncharacterized protein VOLCADRAFT_91006 [Volvox carteri f. nagariensis]EFJ48383.1 hypothetical protein VOLCADRAFT_91006 [Volvox carteri f. nagariensis]|eukprot:XP_002950637.1 hypothetical protein VOLCADRAFT_91006 [Volvox carteri f. nagariensis]